MNVLHVITSRMQNEKYFREKVEKQVPRVIDCIELSMYDKLHITNTLHMMKWWISNSNRTFFNTCQKYKKDNIYMYYAPSHRYICMTWTYHCMNIVEWQLCFCTILQGLFTVDSHIPYTGTNKGKHQNSIALLLGKVLNLIEYECKCIMMYLLRRRYFACFVTMINTT